MSASSPIDQLVVVGASAGGIEALSTLVSGLPADFPAPIIIAQHLDPSRPSHLEEILSRRSSLTVRTVVDHAPLTRGTVFVVPADRHVLLSDHRITLSQGGTGRPKPSVDLLFRSAAEVFGDGLIAVVLSGTGNDGAEGAQVVKEAGGTVVIQDPQTASFPGMPSAVVPTIIDIIAPLEGIGPLLADLVSGVRMPGRNEDVAVDAILALVREQTGFDFAPYKRPTIRRRLQRRLVATHQTDLDAYRSYLGTQAGEAERLASSFLIKVTTFFRDPEVFTALGAQVVPELIARARERGDELRLWSAGCATGEEAYSLAILVADALGDDPERPAVRLFATDLDREAVAYARRGVFPAKAVANVPDALRARHFTPREDGSYEVEKAVRGMIVFGEHDLGQRAPFPRIDLILCRNVLIYFTSPLQQRALQMFTYALREGGYLVLGNSETPGRFTALYTTDRTVGKIFQRTAEPVPMPAGDIRPVSPRSGDGRTNSAAARELARVRQATQQIQATKTHITDLLFRLPVGIVEVDRRYDISSINGEARRLFGIHGAAIGEDFLHLLRDAPTDQLRAAIDTALRGETPAPLEEVTLGMSATGETHHAQIDIAPGVREEVTAATAVIVVSDRTETVTRRRQMEADRAQIEWGAESEAERQRAEAVDLNARLEALRTANRDLLTANGELARDNEVLRELNQQVVSGSEEIVAASEEVETLNEELQAGNEELETVNEELQATVEELHASNSELQQRTDEVAELILTRERTRIRTEERNLLAQVLEQMPVGVIVAEASSGQVILGNARGEQILGRAMPETGNIASYARWQTRDAMGQAYEPAKMPIARALLRGEEVRDEEMRFPRPEGGWMRVRVNAAPVRNAAGATVAAVLTFAAIDASDDTLAER